MAIEYLWLFTGNLQTLTTPNMEDVKQKNRSRLCSICNDKKAALKRPKTQEQVPSPLHLLSQDSLACGVPLGFMPVTKIGYEKV